MQSIQKIRINATTVTFLSTLSSVYIAKQNGFIARDVEVVEVDVPRGGLEATQARRNDMAIRGYSKAKFA